MFPYTAAALGRAYQAVPRVPNTAVNASARKRAENGCWDIRESEPGVFQVRNLDNGYSHVVVYHDLGEGSAVWSCDCPDYVHRQRACKHILAVWLKSGLVVADVDLAGGRSRIVPISLFGKDGHNPDTLNKDQSDNPNPIERSKMQNQHNHNQPRWAREYVVDDGLAPLYPFIQWVNDGSTLEPRFPTGGFASPVDQVPIGVYAVLHHRDGSQTEVTYTAELRIAVLRTRFSWTKDGALLPSYVPGARGKLQALCLVVDADGQVTGPVILTFTGLSGARFSAEYLRFAREVAKQTRRQAPAYAFFMRVVAGKPEMVGKGQQKSPITPPVWDGDLNLDRDFIGDEALDNLNWDEIKHWAEAWRKPRPNGDGVITEEEYEEEEDIPFEDVRPQTYTTRPARPTSAPASVSTASRPAAPAPAASPRPAAPAPAASPRPAAPASSWTGEEEELPFDHSQPQAGPAAGDWLDGPASPGQRLEIERLMTRLGFTTDEGKRRALAARGYDWNSLTCSQAEEIIARLQEALKGKGK